MAQLGLVRTLIPAAALCLLAGCAAVPTQTAPSYDLLIRHARVVDGSGNPWYLADVAITDGRIATIGTLDDAEATSVVDARGRVLAPGFIDLLGQDTTSYINNPGVAGSRLFQGITTHVSGEGWSHAPQNRQTQPEPVEIGGTPERWTRFSEYFDILERHGLPLNTAYTVGAAQVREVVIGEEDRAPTSDELDAMRDLVRQAMEDGATGLSSALIYPPGIYASDDEIVALAKVVAEYGGAYSTHMRNESHHLLEAIDQSIAIGQRAGVPVHVYHLKAAGAKNWPLMRDALKRINAARDQGIEVTADIYPYIRVGLGLAALVPPQYYANGVEALQQRLSDPDLRRQIRAEMEAGDTSFENYYDHTGQNWDKVLIIYAGNAADPSVAGESVGEAASTRGIDVWTLFFDLVQAGGVVVTPEVLDEAQKVEALKERWVMIETDMSPVNPETAQSSHPRAFGAFPRVLAKYVREDGIIPLEEAIRRMTWMPARMLGLPDRGLIAEGMAADLALFDPERIQDKATFEDPLQFSEGIDWLWVNGTAAIADGQLTGARPGRVLRRPVLKAAAR